GPDDACWPTLADWNELNASVSGNLIADTPIAASCYPGPFQSASACHLVDTLWTNQAFQASNPIGLSYPDDSCPPVNVSAGQKPGECSIGTSPRYTVNATTPDLVSKTIRFAGEKNVRLVVKNTGHDILGRSTGYGSLSVWIRYLRAGIDFHDSYDGDGCSASDWRGAAFTVKGGYTWDDVYPLAAARNLIVVGGDHSLVLKPRAWA
ncbi:MAG: hypothetical protein Q9191_007852, partial [Dirinaria sp. TL-2023a]